MILGWGFGLVQFSCFMHVTYCHYACVRHLWLQFVIVFCFWVVKDVFQVVVGGCWIFEVIQWPCSNLPCKNKGKCVTLYKTKSYVCAYKKIFTGQHCEKGKETKNWQERQRLERFQKCNFTLLQSYSLRIPVVWIVNFVLTFLKKNLKKRTFLIKRTKEKVVAECSRRPHKCKNTPQQVADRPKTAAECGKNDNCTCKLCIKYCFHC